jgi:hypothetical protein
MRVAWPFHFILLITSTSTIYFSRIQIMNPFTYFSSFSSHSICLRFKFTLQLPFPDALNIVILYWVELWVLQGRKSLHCHDFMSRFSKYLISLKRIKEATRGSIAQVVMDRLLLMPPGNNTRSGGVGFVVDKAAVGTFLPSTSVSLGTGIATGYGLDDQGIGVPVPVGSRTFLLHVVQTGSGAHPASYPMGTGGSFPGVKRPGNETEHTCS